MPPRLIGPRPLLRGVILPALALAAAITAKPVTPRVEYPVTSR